MKVTLRAVTQPTVIIDNDPTGGITPPMRLMTPDEFIVFCARASSPQNQLNVETAPRLLAYCIKNKHWSIFEQASMTVEIETSRAIAQQILRHRSFSFQEFSQRYATVDKIGDDLFELVELRLKNAAGNRQGSDESNPPALLGALAGEVANVLTYAEDAYRNLLEEGIAPECARMVLPLCTRTRLYMTGTVRSWIHYLEQRCDPHAQKEHRQVAEEIKKIFCQVFPQTAAALDWIGSPAT